MKRDNSKSSKGNKIIKDENISILKKGNKSFRENTEQSNYFSAESDIEIVIERNLKNEKTKEKIDNKIKESSNLIKKEKNQNHLFQVYYKSLEKELTKKGDDHTESSSEILSFIDQDDSNKFIVSSDESFKTDRIDMDYKKQIKDDSFYSGNSISLEKTKRKFINENDDLFLDPYKKQIEKIEILMNINDFKKANEFRTEIIKREKLLRKTITKKGFDLTCKKLDDADKNENKSDDDEGYINTHSDHNDSEKNDFKNHSNLRTFNKIKESSKLNYYEENLDNINLNDIKIKSRLSLVDNYSRNKNEEEFVLANTIDGKGLYIVDSKDFNKNFIKEEFLEYCQWIPKLLIHKVEKPKRKQESFSDESNKSNKSNKLKLKLFN